MISCLNAMLFGGAVPGAGELPNHEIDFDKKADADELEDDDAGDELEDDDDDDFDDDDDDFDELEDDDADDDDGDDA